VNPAELADIIASGSSALVGTRTASLRPDCTRAAGIRVEPGGRELTLFLPDATSARTLANLRDNRAIAAVFTRVVDHRSIQAKGRAVEIRPADEADREAVERYMAAFTEAVAVLGCPARLTRRMATWPCHAVRMTVDALFVQTPGPGAGARVERGAP